MKTLHSEFAKWHVRNINIYNTQGYSIYDESNYRRLVLKQHGKEIGHSHTFSLDGCCSNGLVDYDISNSSPAILAICEFTHVDGTDYMRGKKKFLINFYCIDNGITKESLPIATYKIDGAFPYNKPPRISFINDFKLVIVSPCENQINNSYRLLIFDLLGSRIIAETQEFQSISNPYYLSVNEKYVGIETYTKEDINNKTCYNIYDITTLNLISKIILDGGNIKPSLLMRDQEKFITKHDSEYSVFDVLTGKKEFSVSHKHLKIIMPAFLNDIHRCGLF